MQQLAANLTMGAWILVVVTVAGCQPSATTPKSSANTTAPAESAAASAEESALDTDGEPAASADTATTPPPATSTTAPLDTPPRADPAEKAPASTTNSAQPNVEAAPSIELLEDGNAPAAAADMADDRAEPPGPDQPQRSAVGAPLLLDDGPLLLDDGASDTDQPVADNSRCMHCHLNFADEELATTHAHANIGCAKCHGNCDAHIADESWASGGNGTPPGIMYPRDKIVPACLECHPRDKIDIDEHQAWMTGKAKDKVCTDCHGEHRIPGPRKCKWK